MAKEKIIEIDPSAGFCFGVEKAITTSEQIMKDGGPVYGLGEMVHNEEELARLDKLGMKTISHAELRNIKSGKVVLRAHGEPPSTYELARSLNIEIIDASCPIVLKLQEKIRKCYKQLNREKEQIVIFGKKAHPETIGLLGQTNNEAVLITDPSDLSKIEKGKSIYLFSQTTMDPDQFSQLEANIHQLSKVADSVKIESSCSICGQMKKRKPDLRKFALSHDLVIFVSGKKSSNGAMLYNYCREINKNSYWIHSTKDIDPGWLESEGSIGISGSTSTPVWQLQQVKMHLESLKKA